MKKYDDIIKILSKCKKEISTKFDVNEIGIFGSYVRGEAKKTSDIDILVNLKHTVSLLKLVSLENYLSDALKTKVDVIPKKDIRRELRKRILGEVTYI